MEFLAATGARKAIHYALVARRSIVLAEFSAVPTHAKAIARQILDKMPSAYTHDGNSYVSYATHDGYIYHVRRSSETGLTVLCMADDTAGRLIPYTFLHDIHAIFHKNYGTRDLHTSLAYAMNDEFSRVLSQQMHYYSNISNATRIIRTLPELSEFRHVMVENIEKILDRPEKIEVQVHQTGSIQDSSYKFAKQSSRYKNRGCWRNVKLTTGFVLLLIVLPITVIKLFF